MPNGRITSRKISFQLENSDLTEVASDLRNAKFTRGSDCMTDVANGYPRQALDLVRQKNGVNFVAGAPGDSQPLLELMRDCNCVRCCPSSTEGSGGCTITTAPKRTPRQISSPVFDSLEGVENESYMMQHMTLKYQGFRPQLGERIAYDAADGKAHDQRITSVERTFELDIQASPSTIGWDSHTHDELFVREGDWVSDVNGVPQHPSRMLELLHQDREVKVVVDKSLE